MTIPKRKLFGTDGIRGTANTPPMTAETALRVGTVVAGYFRRGHHRHRVVMAKDTRLSGYMLESALTSGFVSMGMDVILVGPLPTPAVAMLTRSLRADLGVMISASHNPFEDNGIKLFGPDGFKLGDDVERDLEARLERWPPDDLVPPSELGRAKRLDDARGRYTEYVKQTFPRGLRLNGLKVVIDCAHGAAYRVAPEVLWELGADVVPVGIHPDGFNINRSCGSVATDSMREQVVVHGADLGIALDGDADRVLVADETGALVDGDQLMALIAGRWQRDGRLAGGGIVATVMSNLGLERHLQGLGLRLERTAVGDRHVVRHMRENGFNLGGEQSGHMVFGDYSTTGDGLIAALQLLAAVVTDERAASSLCCVFEPVPQVLENVRVRVGMSLDDAAVQRAIEAGEHCLASGGRLLVRLSGTEPVVRVMAEGDDAGCVAGVVGDIVDAIRRAGG